MGIPRDPDARLNRSYYELSHMTTRAVQWYLLISEAEWVRDRTGYGLAFTWDLINHGDYEGARDSLDALMAVMRDAGEL